MDTSIGGEQDNLLSALWGLVVKTEKVLSSMACQSSILNVLVGGLLSKRPVRPRMRDYSGSLMYVFQHVIIGSQRL